MPVMNDKLNHFNPEVLHLQHNTHGRDFVLGDLHGHYRAVQALLEKVKFDYGKDRLFSVGDLVDRGPDSFSCLELLEQPWFFSVLGNHESICLEATNILLSNENQRNTEDLMLLEDYRDLYDGEWLFCLAPEKLSKISFLISRLPIIISIGDSEKFCNIVHAELLEVDGRGVVDADIASWRLTSIPSSVRTSCLSGRELFEAANQNLNKPLRDGLSLTYCGHSPSRATLQYDSHRFIDSGGCFKNGWFSLHEIHTHNIYTYNP